MEKRFALACRREGKQEECMDTFRQTVDVRVSAVTVFMNQVYLWMTAGLALTAFIAWRVAASPAAVEFIYANSMVVVGLFIAQIALVFALSSAIHRFSAATATGLFLLYAALTGVSLSGIFVAFTGGSIANAFLVTAGTFGAMTLYGTVTKRDLTGVGGFLFMGLIGLVIAMLVNLFLQSSMLDFIISGIGVLIFTGLTAYDTQKLRAFGASAPLDDTVAVRRGAILGALTLYLDFINLFLMLLRFFGNRE
jgi:FtsH-binding integral membrane protein